MSRWTVHEGRDLARAVAEIRAVRGLTQEELAEQVDVDRSRIARLEQGISTKLVDLLVHTLRRLDARIVVEFDEDEAPRG